MKLVLHVGQHKTGTSSLQQSFSFNSTKNVSKNFDTLDTAHVNSSFDVISPFSGRFLDYNRVCKNGADVPHVGDPISRQKKLSNLIEVINKSQLKADNLLIISEDFCALHPEELFDIISFFNQYGYEEVFATSYIRPFKNYIDSYAQLMIKSGKSIADLEANVLKANYEKQLLKFKYLGCIDHFSCRLFQPSNFVNSSLKDDFIELADLKCCAADISEHNSNESITQEQANFLNVLNLVGLNHKGSALKMLGIYKPLTSSKFMLPDTLISKSLESSREDVFRAHIELSIDFDVLVGSRKIDSMPQGFRFGGFLSNEERENVINCLSEAQMSNMISYQGKLADLVPPFTEKSSSL